MKVAIRVDASLKIGTGHVMRCLTLADELKMRGAEVLFICRNHSGNLIDYIERSGYKVAKLLEASMSERFDQGKNVSNCNDWLGVPSEIDAAETLNVLESEKLIDWLIIDHYSIDASWEKKQINSVNKIMVIDDLANRAHNCHVLLDQNFYLDKNDRYKGLIPDNCQLFLGPKYSLLRSEFREQRKKTNGINKKNKKIENIFVFFGGVDLKNHTMKAIEALISIVSEEIKINVVIGRTNPYIVELKKICSSVKNINLHVQVEDMAKMMAAADLSIGSGGTVTWERCCLGLPTIAWPVADNQKKLLKDSARFGLVYMPDFTEPSVDEIVVQVRALMQNMSLCESMRDKGLATIDGKGVIRIANFICSPVIDLSVADKGDMEKIFNWRNEPEVRVYSHSSKEIDLAGHESWYEEVLADDNRHILIGSMNDHDIGVIRFDVSESEAEISIYLVKEMMGKGYGSAFVKTGEKWLKRNCPEVKYIVAEVLHDNNVSMRLFEICDYELNEVRYRKSISNV
ncbi:MAG: UDP-2,4-diacetamido-2,4,6-trideoxy-beta-L-altropyranose hydrolase [Pseudomonadota bacterium]